MFDGGTALTVVEEGTSEIATWQEDIDLAQQHAFNADASSTRKNYLTALKQFARYVGRDEDNAIPAQEGEVVGWISRLNAKGLKPATIDVKIAGIAWAHRKLGHPFDRRLLKDVMSGIKRERGTSQRQAPAITSQDITRIVEALPDTLIGKRDKALILIGFAGGMRRSEIVGLDVAADQSGTGFVEFVGNDLLITLTKSKTDQEGAGQRKEIVGGVWSNCPVAALKEWIDAASIDDGAVFRTITKGNKLTDRRLPAESVGYVLRKRGQEVGIQNAHKVSAHSLRASFVTEAHKSGVSLTDIMRQTGHVKVETTQRYIRDAELFSERAATRKMGV